ncbi:MAG: sigma-70 family RNA polymerase sigma factor [Myxococcota bacterium]
MEELSAAQLPPCAMVVELPRKIATDADLVSRAQDGDQEAQAELYRRHVSMAAGLARRLAPELEPVDITQEAFLHAFAKLRTLREPSLFRTWLGAIVVGLTRKRIRRQRMLRRLRLVSSSLVDVDQVVSQDAPPDVKAELRALYSMINALPPDARLALVLRRVDGLEIKEVAERMGVSPTTAKRRIAEGEVLLRSRLKEDQP